MKNPHEKLAMEFFSPPGPSAREWRVYHKDYGYSGWHDGAKKWPEWVTSYEHEIRLKSQTITLPERTIPKPLDVGELTDSQFVWVVDPCSEEWAGELRYDGRHYSRHKRMAERGFFYPHTDQGKADAVAAAKGMINWRDEG